MLIWQDPKKHVEVVVAGQRRLSLGVSSRASICEVADMTAKTEC